MRLENKVVIVTGASDGIGKAAAAKLAEEGAQLVINARGRERLERFQEALGAIGHKPLAIPGDAAVAETSERLVKETMQHFGRIDGLVNNAGGASRLKRLEEITLEDWEQSQDLNLKSAFLLCKQVIPIMKEQHYGRIVNVSSLAGRNKSRLGGLQYSSAKAGLLGLTRHLAWECGGSNITVNAVAPGFVLTDRVRNKWNALSSQEQEKFLSDIPLNRLAQPEDIAGAIAFLISDEAAYITGVSLDVNGGCFMS